MATDSKKHHYVPRSILRNFHNENGRLFVFDKMTSKSFASTADNVAHENYFNTIEVSGERFNFESFFETIDSDQAILFQKLLSFENKWVLTDAEKYKIAYFTLVQWHRTKLSRTSIVEFSNDLQQWMERLTQNTPYKPENTRVDTEQSKVITLAQIQSIPEHIHHLLDRYISIVKAPDNCSFFTSDNPVVLYNPYEYLKTGLGGVGTEICFPISDKLLLNFTCPVTAKKTRTVYEQYRRRGLQIPEPIIPLYEGLFTGKIVTIEPKYVDFYNHLQVKTSSRFLYASVDNFSLVKEMLESAPGLSQVKATMTLGNQPHPEMSEGDHLVLHLEDKEHAIISVELIDAAEDDVDLHFKVAEKDNWKIAMLYDMKEKIEFVQTFRDKMEARGMRDVEIISYDRKTRIGKISHTDKGLNGILKFMNEERRNRGKG